MKKALLFFVLVLIASSAKSQNNIPTTLGIIYTATSDDTVILTMVNQISITESIVLKGHYIDKNITLVSGIMSMINNSRCLFIYMNIGDELMGVASKPGLVYTVIPK